MSTHTASIQWSLSGDSFAYDDYSRNHDWVLSEQPIRASSAPEYLGERKLADPEQALVAAIASCHMLTFLAIASRKRLRVLAYTDEAVGTMSKNDQGRLAVTHVALRPQITFAPEVSVTPEQIEKMHHLSHEECFIANSVTTHIEVIAP
ncbi:MAG: OsmC family protein [Pseudomonadota bacterium]